MPKSFLLILSLTLSLVTDSLLAQEAARLSESNDENRVSISSVNVTNDEEFQTARGWVRDDFVKSVEQNPNVEIKIAQIEPDPTEPVEEVSVDDASSTHEEASSDAEESKLANAAKATLNVKLSIVRTIINSQIQIWTLVINGNIPLYKAAPVGVLVGVMAFNLQFFNERLQKWYVNKGLFQSILNKDSATQMAVARRLDEAYRWFILDISYIGAVKLAMLSLDIAPKATPFEHVTQALWLSFVALIAQAPWELGFAKNAQISTVLQPEREKSIYFRSGLKVLAISALTVLGQSLGLMDVAVDQAFMGLSIIGGGYYLKSLWSERGVLTKGGACSSSFAK